MKTAKTLGFDSIFGETLEEYTNILCSQATNYVRQKFEQPFNIIVIRPKDIYYEHNLIIIEVYIKRKYKKLYSFSYHRNKDDSFSFYSDERFDSFDVFTSEDKMEFPRFDIQRPGFLISKNFEEVSKPFPNEHAARQTDPGQYDTFRRGRPKGFPNGIDVIFGIKNVGGKRVSEIQSLRFKSAIWSADKARKWLKEHNFKTSLEEARKPTKKNDDFWNGIIF